MTTLTTAATLGAIFGLASHWGYFIHGEHHLEGPLILFLLASTCSFAFYGLITLQNIAADVAFQLIVVAVISYIIPLMISIIIYRLFFHRLRKYPGPFMARVTKLYHAYLCSHEPNFRILARWHEKYGPVVRVGPSEVSVLHPSAVQEVYGARTRCRKSPWYDMSHPDVSLHTTRDKALHDSRRRIWDRGFSVKGILLMNSSAYSHLLKTGLALRDFEKRELIYVQQLIELIDKQTGKEVDISKLFNYFSFDVMGDLAFGKSFDMLKGGEEHFALKMVHDGQQNLSILTPLPWLVTLLKSIPGALSKSKRFQSWCANQVEERRKMKPEAPDVMTWLLEDSNGTSSSQSALGRKWLSGDSRLIIVAGSDTTAVTLVHIFYYLAKYPEHLESLRSVLDPIVTGKQEIYNQDLQDIDFLNGIINEALRLHPPVPSGLLRLTPPEGIQCGDIFVPGNTVLSVPFHPLGRSQTAYEKPLEFIPERWYSKPELVHDKTAFVPFSSGRYSCIGKNLALMELRTVTALLATRYDILFAMGEDGSSLLNECQDAFTLFIKPCRLVFKRR